MRAVRWNEALGFLVISCTGSRLQFWRKRLDRWPSTSSESAVRRGGRAAEELVPADAEGAVQEGGEEGPRQLRHQ